MQVKLGEVGDNESYSRRVNIVQTNNVDNFEQQVLTRLGQINERINKLDQDIKILDIKQLEANTKIDAYQRAFNQVVNLAFALISAATVTIIVSAVLNK